MEISIERSPGHESQLADVRSTLVNIISIRLTWTGVLIG